MIVAIKDYKIIDIFLKDNAKHCKWLKLNKYKNDYVLLLKLKRYIIANS